MRILAGVMLDRVAFAVAALAALAWLIVVRWTPALGIQLLLAVVLLAPLAWLWRRARRSIDANVGAWAEEETTNHSRGPSTARTHLVVEHVEGRPKALLLSWDAEQGPLRFDSLER